MQRILKIYDRESDATKLFKQLRLKNTKDLFVTVYHYCDGWRVVIQSEPRRFRSYIEFLRKTEPFLKGLI